MYQLIQNSPGVTRTADGAHIPNDPGNRDWQAYQAWLAAGNTPAAVPPATPERLQAQYTAALDAFIDAKARECGYDNRITCALRAAYPGPYQAEGLAFAVWMDTCYQQGTQALAEVMAGKRKAPTIDAFLKSLPSMEWPTQKGV
jgi:hypothetical protein